MNVARFQIVVSFPEVRDLPLSIGPHLLTLKRQMGGTIVPVTVPADAPASISRLVYQLPDTIVSIALDRIETTIVPPTHVAEDFEGSQRFATRRATDLLGLLLPNAPHSWCGCIAELEYAAVTQPNPSMEAVSSVLFSRLVKGVAIDDVSNFSIQLGSRLDRYFVTYTINAFEVRLFPVEPLPPPGTITRRTIAIADLPVDKRGINILLDVNDRPAAARASAVDDLKHIFRTQREKQLTLLQDLGLNEVAQ